MTSSLVTMEDPYEAGRRMATAAAENPNREPETWTYTFQARSQDAEMRVMEVGIQLFDKLAPASRRRVLHWLGERYGEGRKAPK